jgi:N-acetylglucosaminyldiphosphoundecaprenol N-acetyl-beta-D-mannosaminyltransferase
VTVPALLFGVPIDDLTMGETIDVIERLVIDGRRFGRTHQIATVNVDFLVNALTDPSVLKLLQDADVCIPDGMPIVWAAGAVHMPLRERVAGADLVPALAERSAQHSWRIHLFGSAEGTAEQAAELLRSRYPGALVSGVSGPFMRDITAVEPDVLDEIRAADADILCVALGNPKQERFISLYGAQLGVPVMIGVGGTLDFLIGGRRRAPEWIQRIGLEWLVRTIQEPGRLGKRYAHDARVFFPQLLTYVRRVRALPRTGSLGITVADGSVRVGVRSPTDSPSEGLEAAIGALERGESLAIELADAPALPAPAFATLIGLLRVARRTGSRIACAQPSRVVLAAAHRLGVDALLPAIDG